MKIKANSIFGKIPRYILIAICCEISIGTIMVSTFLFRNYSLIKIGQPSPYTIVAPYSVSVVDTEETKRLQQQALVNVKEVYSLDATVLPISEAKLRSYLESKGIKENTKEWKAAFNLLRQSMKRGIYPWELEDVIKSIQNRIDGMNVPENVKPVLKESLRLSLATNVLPDKDKTAELRLMVKKRVGNVTYRVVKGQVVVRKGDIIGRKEMLILRALNILPPHFPYLRVGAVFVFVLILTYVLYVYLKNEHSLLLESASTLLFISVVTLIAMVVTRFTAVLSSFFIPTAFVGMMIAVLLNKRLGVFLSIVASLAVAMMLDGDILIFSMCALGSVVGVYLSGEATQRIDLIRVGISVGIVNILVVFIGGMIPGENIVRIVSASLWAGAGGILTAVMVSSMLPHFESAFGLISNIRLLELGMPDQPLLKRLQIEAPGTYHHSLNVANLAEVAAKAVGANALLARVGAYYHDIGKLKRPTFFTENQGEGFENLMETIMPNLSILVIINHVKEGVELAKKYKLPSPIIDFIAQHHGTGVIGYFYSKAKEDLGEANVNKDDFRYPGPKPKTKETAIVMLADSVEAAVRSLENKSPAKIESMVRDIIRSKLEDGQLDESDLKFTDLQKVIKEFTRVLTSMYHSRVRYPEEGEKGA